MKNTTGTLTNTGFKTEIIGLVLALVISGWQPYDRLTWLMEVVPVLMLLPVLVATRQRYPLTTVLYVLIFIHALILMAGGAWSYARVPLGFQLEQWLDLSRNPYDKIGHFFQGLVPALAAREILLRGNFLNPHNASGNKMLMFIACCVALAVSACYELVEWFAALVLGQGAEEFLGTQGDIWDTQSDMLFALTGAISGLALFSPLQNRQISAIEKTENSDDKNTG